MESRTFKTMPRLQPLRAAALAASITIPTGATLAVSVATPACATAQAPKIPIRAVTAPTATSALLHSVDELREIVPGRILVNDGNDRQLLMFDATLQHPAVLADSVGTRAPYPRA